MAKEAMTISYKYLGSRHPEPLFALAVPRLGPSNRPAREIAAPALFRLLSESALYRAAFSACGVALGIVDARLPRPQLVQVNQAFERFFGLHGSDACRHSVAALLLNGDVALERRLFVDVPTREWVMIQPLEGDCVAVEITIDPLRDSAGQLTHWAVSFAASRERTRLRESEALAAQA